MRDGKTGTVTRSVKIRNPDFRIIQTVDFQTVFRLNGFISIGPALLNDHAVNYRDLAKRIPDDRILVESDATAENAAEVPSAESVAEFLADLRGVPRADFFALLDANASRFVGFAP